MLMCFSMHREKLAAERREKVATALRPWPQVSRYFAHRRHTNNLKLNGVVNVRGKQHSPPWRRRGVRAIEQCSRSLDRADGVFVQSLKPFLDPNHPVCAASVASQHFFMARHPSLAKEGNDLT